MPYLTIPAENRLAPGTAPSIKIPTSLYFVDRLAHITEFALYRSHRDFEEGGRESVDSIRNQLLSGEVLKKPVRITAEGTFSPSLLLYSGWWERRAGARKPRRRWRDPLQEWLFIGFEDWGPSWDINSTDPGEKPPYLLGQVAAGDESESLAVVVVGERASRVREHLLDRRRVFEADVTGLLCHRSHLSETELSDLGEFGKAFDYCIKLDDDNRQHRIEPRTDRAQYYSGYLWQCVVPKQWMRDEAPPLLGDTFFVWEHTDFTKPDAIAYNLDSLARKVAYLESKHGPMVLLQKSSAFVPGDPQYRAEDFYRVILHRE